MSEGKIEKSTITPNHFDAIDQSYIAIDAAVFSSHNNKLDSFFEQILAWVNTKFGKQQFINAKDEFYWKNGKIFPEDQFYHDRMAYFTDYFLFHRLLETSSSQYLNLTPFQAFLASTQKEKEDMPIQDFLHSIFLVLKVKQKYLLIKDLFTGKKYPIVLSDFQNIAGILKKDMFQGYVYFCDSQYMLSRGLIFHPYQVHKIIKKHIKQIRKYEEYDSTMTLSKYARLQLRHKRHQHVDPKYIYTHEPT